ncbi:MAG: hypothetical protein IKP86_05070 [Anaerolineaceae bacterium]|nr:hypothetical protein [Anaerolineaceae bacterium]
MTTEYRKTLDLKAEHVDCFRRLRLSVLMRLFQECCIAHTEELGMGREKTLDRGFLWVINSETIEISRLPEYDEQITLVCSPGKTLHFFFPRRMSVLDRSGTEIIRIGAVWSLIDIRTRKWIDPGGEGIVIHGEDLPDDVKTPLSLPRREPQNITADLCASYSLVDINGHVNNAGYMDLVLDRLSFTELGTLSVKTVRCLFRKEIPPGTTFPIEWGRLGSTLYFQNEYFTIELETR